MLDIGWTELLLIGIVALIVVGPKDLPGMFRTLGQFTGKARRMARDFQRAMESAADEAGVKDVASDLKKAANPGKMGLDAVKDAAKDFSKWEPKTPAAEQGGETAKLAEERAEAARKIREATAARTSDRVAVETATAPKPADDGVEATEAKAKDA